MINFQKTPDLPPYGNNFISRDYTVRINGSACPVRSCRVSAMPFNCVWPGHQRPLEQTELASYVSFEADETVVVEVQPKRAFKNAVIRPLSKKIAVEKHDGIIRFTLEKAGNYVLELDDEHFALHIFMNKVEDFPEKEKATYYFGPGAHFPGKIVLKSGDRVYVDNSAVVYASFYGKNVENVKIFGHGVIDSRTEERAYCADYLPMCNGNIKFYESHDIHIDGVILMDSPVWCTSFFGCHDITVEKVKIVGQWRYNTDGIDVVNSQRVKIIDCFIRAFDDVISLKGIDAYKELPEEDITVSGCILWCGWGRTCEVGIETYAPEYKHITFEDCDLIHNSASAIDIQNGGTADIHDIVFRDLRVEFHPFTQPEVYQCCDSLKYDSEGHTGRPYLIFADNHKFLNSDTKYGITRDVLYKNINVILEEGSPLPPIKILSLSPEAPFTNFMIDGLFVNGKRITDLNYFDFETNEFVVIDRK
jgi:hypothetical protein